MSKSGERTSGTISRPTLIRGPSGRAVFACRAPLVVSLLCAAVLAHAQPAPNPTGARGLGDAVLTTSLFETQLADAGVTPDAAGIGAYLSLYQPGPDRRQEYLQLVEQLGDDDFHDREQAMLDLLRRPVPLTDELQRAAAGADPEVRWRAQVVLEQSQQAHHELLHAALAVVRDRKVPGLAEGVLGVNAAARGDARLRLALTGAFYATVNAADVELLRRHLAHEDLNVRVMVISTFGTLAGEAASADLAPLLDDAEDIVKITAAEQLVAYRHPGALRTLGRLLESRHLSIRNRSIQVLRTEVKASLSYSGYDPEGVRRQNAVRWREAIEEHIRAGGTAAAQTPPEEVDRGILVYAVQRNQQFEIDPRGQVIVTEGFRGATDCRQLANGDRLLTLGAQRKLLQVDARGQPVWELSTPYRPLRTERLANGNTLVATITGDLLEFAPVGTLVGQRHFDELIRDIRACPEGDVLIVTFQPGRLIRLNPAGDVVWRSAELEFPSCVCPCADGHFIVALSRDGVLVDVDPDGKAVELTDRFDTPQEVRQSARGQLLVLDRRGLHMIERSGEFVATLHDFLEARKSYP